MKNYILKRVMYSVFSLFIICTITFFFLRMIPGNPIEAMTEKLPDNVRQQVFQQYGFDKSITEQYKIFWCNIVKKGDLGESIKYRGRKVTDTIKEFTPVSAKIGIQAIMIGVTLGIILGMISAFNRGKILDYLVTFIAIFGISIPNFVIGSTFQYFLSIKLGWFPTTGWEGFSYTVLPSLALSLNSTAKYARYMRASCLDVINQDYILTAKAKGVSTFRLICKHVLRNSLLPIITLLGPQIALVFTGAFVIEKIFSIPGMGFYFVSSVLDQDYTMVMGQTIFIAALYIFSILIVDILYGFIDPRIRIRKNS
ncbi:MULTISPECIES: ABC transporter permease [unclassified Clostridium]|uniref:ABC transporter permease n=1 Tax=unclassified Clostridium TaxID=2614128 RepID=UPI003F919496